MEKLAKIFAAAEGLKRLSKMGLTASELRKFSFVVSCGMQVKASDFNNGLRRYYAVPNQKLAMKPKKKPPNFARFQNDFSDRRSYKKL